MAAAWPRLLAVTHAARAAQSPSPPALLLLSHNPLFCLSANTLSNTTGAQCGSGLQARGTWPCPASTYRFVRFRQPAATCHTCNTYNVAQFVAFQTLKQEHRKSFLPCRHLAAPSYIINNTSSLLHHPSIISMINISIVQYSHYFPPQLLIAIGSTIQNLIHRTTHQSLKYLNDSWQSY